MKAIAKKWEVMSIFVDPGVEQNPVTIPITILFFCASLFIKGRGKFQESTNFSDIASTG